MKKIETSALIGLGALGILFGRKMPGVKVIADAGRIARYSAQPVVCNGEECHFDYVTPEQGQPVDLLLVAVKATVLEQAIRDMKKFIGPDTIILSVLSGKWLWPTISVLAAYLCCQLRRWVALLVIAMVPGIDWLQPAVEIVVTLPLLAVLLRYVAPAARSFARYPRSMQLLFGVVPLAGYLFDM